MLQTTPSPDPDSGRSHPAWYALRVRSNFERIVERSLDGKGYEVFAPTFVERRQRTDRVKAVTVPLFPGYVFCRMDASDRLPVLKAPGVIDIVSQGKKPAPVEEQEIESVKHVVHSSLPYAPAPVFVPGQPVIVHRGPLAGVRGVLVENRHSHRLLISITLVQRAVAVDIDAGSVRPVGAPDLRA